MTKIGLAHKIPDRPQKFASVHANVHNHFNLERHLIDRRTYKIRRSGALAEWQTFIV